MTPSLSQRLLGCPGFRWMAGMLGRFPDGSSCRVQDGGPFSGFDGERWHSLRDVVPDLDDPATLGAVMRLVQDLALVEYNANLAKLHQQRPAFVYLDANDQIVEHTPRPPAPVYDNFVKALQMLAMPWDSAAAPRVAGFLVEAMCAAPVHREVMNEISEVVDFGEGGNG